MPPSFMMHPNEKENPHASKLSGQLCTRERRSRSYCRLGKVPTQQNDTAARCRPNLEVLKRFVNASRNVWVARGDYQESLSFPSHFHFHRLPVSIPVRKGCDPQVLRQQCMEPLSITQEIVAPAEVLRDPSKTCSTRGLAVKCRIWKYC